MLANSLEIFRLMSVTTPMIAVVVMLVYINRRTLMTGLICVTVCAFTAGATMLASQWQPYLWVATTILMVNRVYKGINTGNFE